MIKKEREILVREMGRGFIFGRRKENVDFLSISSRSIKILTDKLFSTAVHKPLKA